MLAAGKPFQDSMVFVGKARAYPIKAGFRPCPQTIDWAGKACQEKTLGYNENS
jgi:hypothetical protein